MDRLIKFAGLVCSIAVAAVGMACSAGGQTSLPDFSMLPDLSPPPDLTSGDLKDPGYPPGPYGPNVGDTLPDFTFQGYFTPKQTMGLSSSNPFGEVTFGMLHNTGARFALLEIAAFY